jgi:hypothetical protein
MLNLPILDVVKVLNTALYTDTTLSTLFGGNPRIVFSQANETLTLPFIIIDADAFITHVNGNIAILSRNNFTIKVCGKESWETIEGIMGRVIEIVCSIGIGVQGGTTYYPFCLNSTTLMSEIEENITFVYLVSTFSNVGF